MHNRLLLRAVWLTPVKRTRASTRAASSKRLFGAVPRNWTPTACCSRCGFNGPTGIPAQSDRSNGEARRSAASPCRLLTLAAAALRGHFPTTATANLRELPGYRPGIFITRCGAPSDVFCSDRPSGPITPLIRRRMLEKLSKRTVSTGTSN